MIKNLATVILMSLVVLSCSVEDTSSPMPEDVFVKYFGVSGQQKAVDVIYNEVLQQYFILASQDLGDASGKNFYYIVADKSGDLIMSQILDSIKIEGSTSPTASYIDEPKRLKRLNDAEYLILGTSTDLNENSHIVWGIVPHDLSNNGLYYSVSNSAAPFDLKAADIILTDNDTNILILGTTSLIYPGDLVDPATAGQQFFISKRDFTNIGIWNTPKTLGVNGDDIALAAFELDDNKFAFFGSTESDTDGTRVYAAFTNSLGTSDGSGGSFGINSSVKHSDLPNDVISVGSNFKIVGTSSFSNATKKAFIMGVSKYGVFETNLSNPSPLESDFKFGTTSISTNALTLAPTLDGGYLILGSYPLFQITKSEIGESESRQEEIMLMKTDANGVKFTGLDQYYGLESGNDRANKAITLPDGKVAVVGTFDFGSGTTLIGLMKLNANGELRN
jgi:hypothetical protein